MKPKFLILAGDGINCERESAKAIEYAGGEAKIVHINDLVADSRMLGSFQGLFIPGGFSFGDELGSGLILATKIKHQLADEFKEFVQRGGAVLGVCNGFQVITKLGLLPFPFEVRSAALAHNESGQFMNRWASMKVSTSTTCKWLEPIRGETLNLPVRHGEGRLLFSSQEVHQKVKDLSLDCLKYSEDINGSTDRIAGLTDPSGMILGMMPHPEAFLTMATAKNPTKNFDAPGDGAKIFKSMLTYLLES